MVEKIVKSEAEWAEVLDPDTFRVLRDKGTERAFTGIYWDHHEEGVYRCAGCGQPLFSSGHKFDSGSGWPSFYQTTSEDAVETEPDDKLFMRRTELHCSQCGGHLGHVFSDGPQPTGLRYCVNSVSLDFEAAQDDD